MERPRRRTVGFAIVALAAVLTVQPAAAGVEGTHTGNYGLHWLLDSSEYGGATCKYDSNDRIDRIKARRPIVFAYDRSGQVDTQYVGWKAVIQYADGKPVAAGASPDLVLTWTTYETTPLTKVQASDQHPAKWLPKAVDLPSNAYQHEYWRVRVWMRWFYPSSSNPDGTAVHYPTYYDYDLFNGGPDTTSDYGYCYGSLGA